MANSKGNAYPYWFIGIDYAVYAVDTSGAAKKMSEANFAIDVSISEDGTVWVLSTTPDPDGGGSKIFWSNGDSNWNEIATSDPGGIRITGAGGSNCIFITYDDRVYTLAPSGNGKLDFSGLEISEISFGGGYLWTVMPESPGGKAELRFLRVDDATKQWKTFPTDDVPFQICTASTGVCSGIVDYTAKYFSTAGESGPLGAGLNGQTLQIGYKTWSYALSANANENGNLIYKWVDEQGGLFQPTENRGTKVVSSYHINE